MKLDLVWKACDPRFNATGPVARGTLPGVGDGKPIRVSVRERELNVWLRGADSGRVLVFHTGTPSPPVWWPSLDRAARDRRLRLVSYARPGYSGSARQPGRSVADAATDTLAVLDAIAADDFVVMGHSGGGPHALACAALLPQRCLAAVSLAGLGPYGIEGFDWMAGMAAENVEEFNMALLGEPTLGPYLAAYAEQFANVTADQVAASLASLVSEVDRKVLTGERADVMARSLRQAASDGVDGWLDDDLAFVAPWGFNPALIGIPVAVWQGRQDRMVPFTHGEWLADQIPTAAARLFEDEGHVSLLTNRLGDILDDLLDLA